MRKRYVKVSVFKYIFFINVYIVFDGFEIKLSKYFGMGLIIFFFIMFVLV